VSTGTLAVGVKHTYVIVYLWLASSSLTSEARQRERHGRGQVLGFTFTSAHLDTRAATHLQIRSAHPHTPDTSFEVRGHSA
jgi:hypothetical protein